MSEGNRTFVLTDIEDSSKHWARDEGAMARAVTRHDELAKACFAEWGGQVINRQAGGDALFCVFENAAHALACLLTLQQKWQVEAWTTETPIRVRVGVHWGEALLRDGDYYGSAVNRCARLRDIGWGGQVLVSRAVREQVGANLPTDASLLDLGTHYLRDLQEPEQVYQLAHPSLPAEFPPLRSLTSDKHNLPRQVHSFVGRERELAHIADRLTQTRLLTLTGTGGTGKTRLALQAAADALERYPEGVWLADLASLTDDAQVPFAVARALNIAEEAGKPLLQTLTNALKPRHLLLILDNCEQRVAACAVLVHALLSVCPNLSVLATSREPLGASGEEIYPLPTLSLPNPTDRNLRDHMETSEAVRLFVERAASVKPDFALNDQNYRAVAQICWRLDGIPLALELAAPRLRALSSEQLAQRLDDRFRLITGGSRNTLPHHQTLRALFDYSYDPLPDEEKLLFARLGVFSGGWTLEAAEAVCVGGVVEDWEVLEHSTRLVEKSLILAEETPDGGMRYRMLETLREYSREKLAASDEANELREKRLRWILAYAEDAEKQLKSPQRAHALRLLEQEHNNARSALEWALQAGTYPDECVRLGAALIYFWAVRGELLEGQEWSQRLLEASLEGASSTATARLLNGIGVLHWRRSDFAEAQEFVERALTLYEQIGDSEGAETVCRNLGLILADTGEYDRAAELLQRSLHLHRQQKNSWMIAAALNNLGLLEFNRGCYEAARTYWMECAGLRRIAGERTGLAETLHNLCLVMMAQGDYDSAQKLEEESLLILRDTENDSTISYVIHNLGDLAYLRRDLSDARTHYEEACTLFEEQGDQWGICASVLRLGSVSFLEGNLDAAWDGCQKALALADELDEKRLQAESLEMLAAMLHTRHADEDAARLVGMAELRRDSLHSERAPFDAAAYNALHSELREALEAGRFASMSAEGLSRTLDEVALIPLPFPA